MQGTVLDIAYLGNLVTYHVELADGRIIKAQTANTRRLSRRSIHLGRQGLGLVERHRRRVARAMNMRRFFLIAVPYVWLLALFLVPFFIVFKISLSDLALCHSALYADDERRHRAVDQSLGF